MVSEDIPDSFEHLGLQELPVLFLVFLNLELVLHLLIEQQQSLVRTQLAGLPGHQTRTPLSPSALRTHPLLAYSQFSTIFFTTFQLPQQTAFLSSRNTNRSRFKKTFWYIPFQAITLALGVATVFLGSSEVLSGAGTAYKI